MRWGDKDGDGKVVDNNENILLDSQSLGWGTGVLVNDDGAHEVLK